MFGMGSGPQQVFPPNPTLPVQQFAHPPQESSGPSSPEYGGMGYGLPANPATVFGSESSVPGATPRRGYSAVMPFTPGGAYLYMRHLAGDGVGYEDGGYTTLGAWTPLMFDPLRDQQVVYLDSRFSMTNEAEMVGNFGFGYRKHVCEKGITFGVHGFYDIDAANNTTFNQVGGGFEVLTPQFDIHANAYVPVGRTKHTLFSSISNPQFQGNSIVFDQFLLLDRAMLGFDVDVSVPLPYLDRMGIQAYLGWYRYEADHGNLLNGARATLLLRATRSIELQLTVNHDGRFGTTTILGGTYTFGRKRRFRSNACAPEFTGCQPCRPCETGRSLRELMTRPVRRSDRIVVNRSSYVGASTPATDASTKQPFRIVHVNSAAVTTGNGTIETPFQSLADAQTASNPGDIIYVHADSVLNGAAGVIALQNNQRLLGEGLAYQVNTCELGNILLPRATNGTTKPQLANVPTSAITLANDNEVANFNITNAATSGIVGTGIGGSFNIHDVMISQSGSHGIDIAYNDVFGWFMNNMVTQSGAGGVTGDGIRMVGTTFEGDFVNNMTDNNFDEGISINTTDFNGDITNNTANSNGFRGIGIFTDNFTGNTTGNTTNGNNGEGLWLNAEFFTGVVSNNTANNNTVSGMLIKGNTTFNADITNNVANSNVQLRGIHLEGGVFTGLINGNQMDDNRNEALFIEVDGLNSTVSNNTMTNSFIAEGFRLNVLSSGNVTGQFLNNSLSGNKTGGDLTELLVTHNGTGTMLLEFSGNTTTNVPPAGSFNYDLQNQSTGVFNLRFLTNTGTFGTTSGTAPTIVP